MSGASPGWYPDPTDAGRWRWYDGQAWTEHVSSPPAPQPAPTPPAAFVPPSEPVAAYAGSYASSHSAAPTYGSRFGAATYAGSSTYGAPAVTPYSGSAHRAPSGQEQGSRRTLVIVASVIGGLVVLGLVSPLVTSALRSAAGIKAAPGPRTVLLPASPQTLDGMPISSDPYLTSQLASWRSELDQEARAIGATDNHVEVYGSSAHGGLIGWAVVTTPMAQAAEVASSRAQLSARPDVSGMVEYAEPDGATILCAQVGGANGRTGSLCAWLRSGSGVVTVAEINGRSPSDLADVTRQVVLTLSGAA